MKPRRPLSFNKQKKKRRLTENTSLITGAIMIENAVASTLMRLPVAELSALRKIFMASPGGLSVEGFVEAMLPSAYPDTPRCSSEVRFA